MTEAQKFVQFIRDRLLKDAPDALRIEGESLIVTHRFTVPDTQLVCPLYKAEQRS